MEEKKLSYSILIIINGQILSAEKEGCTVSRKVLQDVSKVIQ
jgi:hypothetical protein